MVEPVCTVILKIVVDNSENERIIRDRKGVNDTATRKAIDPTTKTIKEVTKEIELLAIEAHELKQGGGNHYNVIAEIDRHYQTLKQIIS